MMVMRRVVIGDDGGKSRVLREEFTTTGPVGAQEFVWRTEQPPSVPNDGAISEETSVFPPAGGVWVMRWEVPAGVTHSEGSDLLTFDEGRPGFHATDSVDVDIVLSGSIVLELDEEDVTLNAGDVAVVNGNSHAWRNDGDETAVVLSVLTGATRGA